MDHILEHEGQPVPDLSALAMSAGGDGGGGGGPTNEDDEEDADAIKSLGVGAAGVQEAKVVFEPLFVLSYWLILFLFLLYDSCLFFSSLW